MGLGPSFDFEYSLSDSEVDAQNNILYSFGHELSLSSASNQNPIIYFKNPSGSGKSAYIKKIFVALEYNNLNCDWSLYSDITVSANGTSLTAKPRHLGNSQGSSVMNIYSKPTVTSAYAQPLSEMFNAQNSSSVEILQGAGLILKPNSNILLTGVPDVVNRTACVTFVWSEL